MKCRDPPLRLILSIQTAPATLVAERRWREDFHYRVAAITLLLPALAERQSDIPLLANHFLTRLGRSPIALEELSPLQVEAWPGNVRQLRRVVERAVFEVGDRPVTAGDIRHSDPHAAVGSPGQATELMRTLREVEREHIERVLRATGFATDLAAPILGLSRSQLYRRMAAAGIRPPRRS